MNTPPPPSLRQADKAHQARFAAERSVLSLFQSIEVGGGGGSETNLSVLQTIQMADILKSLSAAIILASFQHPRDKMKSLLSDSPDHDVISEKVLPEGQVLFRNLIDSDLSDEQRATVWATWAHSRTASEIAEAVSSGEIPHPFIDQGRSLNKIWISRTDGKVRPLHVKLHGKTVPHDGDFWRWPDTDHRLRWPGDRDAPMDATIGCRCACLLSWADQSAVADTIKKIVDRSK